MAQCLLILSEDGTTFMPSYTNKCFCENVHQKLFIQRDLVQRCHHALRTDISLNVQHIDKSVRQSVKETDALLLPAHYASRTATPLSIGHVNANGQLLHQGLRKRGAGFKDQEIVECAVIALKLSSSSE